MLIAINAGHYPGEDSGALGVHSTEAEVVRDIAKIVCADLEKVGYQTVFIQENSLDDICDIANSNNADLFVSIHMNAAEGNAKGTETWYHEGSVNGACLANCIQEQLVDTMGSVDRGIKCDTTRYRTGFAVLRDTYMPAALAEVDFIDNPIREDYVTSHITPIAHAIARGVTDYVADIR